MGQLNFRKNVEILSDYSLFLSKAVLSRVKEILLMSFFARKMP